LLHLQLILLQLIDLVSDQFHLLDLLSDLILDLLAGAALVFEFRSQRVEDLIQSMVWRPRRRGSQVGIATVLSCIEHFEW
jgi:hypothetical protein